jgi:hypothetical protein
LECFIILPIPRKGKFLEIFEASPGATPSIPESQSVTSAGDELPPPRGARWELSEKQFDCLRVPGGAQQRDRPPFPRRADAPKTESPNLTKHQTSQPQYREEVVPPHMYAPTTDNGPCHSINPARQSFTVPDLEDYAMQTRSGRPDMISTTTTSKEPAPEKTTTLCSDAATRQNQPPTSRNTNITAPVPERKSCPLTRTPPRRTTELVPPFVLPDNGLRFGGGR